MGSRLEEREVLIAALVAAAHPARAATAATASLGTAFSRCVRPEASSLRSRGKCLICASVMWLQLVLLRLRTLSVESHASGRVLFRRKLQTSSSWRRVVT